MIGEPARMSYGQQPPYPPQQPGPQQDPWQTGRHVPVSPPPSPPPAGWPSPARKKSRAPLIIGVVVGLGVLLCGGTVAAVALAGGSVAGHTIRFEVTTAGGAASLINWSTLEDSAVENDVGATQGAPWVKEVKLEDQLGLVGVNASAADGGKVACKLFVDGKLVDEGESNGVVNCSDTVG